MFDLLCIKNSFSVCTFESNYTGHPHFFCIIYFYVNDTDDYLYDF